MWGMVREFTVVIERDAEGYLVASVPALPGCHTQVRSMGEVMERVREAILLSLDADDAEDIGRLELVGTQRASRGGR